MAKYRDSFHLFAATGRPLRLARPIIRMLGITNLCAISGGTIIYDPVADQVIKVTPLLPEIVHAVFKIACQYNYEVSLREEIISSEITRLNPTLAENIEIMGINRVRTHDVAGLGAALRAVPGICAEAVHDWAGNGTFAFLITDFNATKEHAVAEILTSLGVKPEEAIGIGDGNNDLHLFRSVGLKVAMGNATPELKAAADIIAPSVDDNGLAEIIEQYAGQPILASNRN
ncbi:MAG: hypothetical protein NVSMB39_3790 [Candidatus Saccharimonadales bacterium]